MVDTRPDIIASVLGIHGRRNHMASKSPKIPLSELIGSVTGELQNAQLNAIDRGSSLMVFEECEFEFGIEAEKNADGGVNVWVLDISGGIKKTESNTIRIKFKANPANPVQAPSIAEGAGPALKKQS